jgi:hypothetical protein
LNVKEALGVVQIESGKFGKMLIELLGLWHLLIFDLPIVVFILLFSRGLNILLLSRGLNILLLSRGLNILLLSQGLNILLLSRSLNILLLSQGLNIFRKDKPSLLFIINFFRLSFSLFGD